MLLYISVFFFFNDTATTEIYTLSLHDALPILAGVKNVVLVHGGFVDGSGWEGVYKALKKEGYTVAIVQNPTRSEEHTSELQSLAYLVCRLLLEKKKKNRKQKSRTKSHLATPHV